MILSVLAAATLIAGCADGGIVTPSAAPATGPSQTMPVASTSPTATPTPAVSPSVSPSQDGVLEPAAYGPLAVIPPQDGTDLARIEGVLDIGASCVLLDERGTLVLLAWPADLVRWDAAAGAVTFRNEDGTTVTRVDGDRVALGGSGSTAGVEGGAPTATWVQTIDWVVPPDASCLVDARWFVGAMLPPG